MSGPAPIRVDDEERVASEMSRELDALAAERGIQPPVGFADRVMAAVAEEPLPQPARAFRVALLAGRLGPALASVRDAWRVVVGGSTPRAVRAQALALVLIVTTGSLAVAAGAAVGAIDVLTANPPSTPSPTTPLPSNTQISPLPSPSPSPTLTPDRSPDTTPTQDGGQTPEGTETPGATQRPGGATSRPSATDDHGGSSGSGSGAETPGPTASATDDHGGSSGSGSGAETPGPTASATDDHGGG